MTVSDHVTHANCAFEIDWGQLQMTRAEQDAAMRKIKALSDWRHPEVINHTRKVTHLFPQTPRDQHYTVWYGKLRKQIVEIIDEVKIQQAQAKAKAKAEAKAAERRTAINGVTADQYIQWMGDGLYCITPLGCFLFDDDTVRSINSTIRSRRKVKSVRVKNGMIFVTSNSHIKDDVLIEGLHHDVVHKAMMRVGVLAK